ncbi:uncharacterized protein LOC107040686 [Diachasma alloeum]|uniref:uncharacterized protein LOC107040686 n=1 Tax=Diachasma alloeum TaxID=454923 RepID=UPI0007382F3F|nr:uncharacterized protein LOC107040686 [Diachasma alloeum]
MIILFHFFFLFAINSQVTGYGKSRITWHDSKSCAWTKSAGVDGINPKEVRNSIGKEYNCGVMGIGVVQKIPYDESQDQLHVVFSSACVKCGLCIAIADKINKSLVALHEAISCNRYIISAEAEVRMGTFCADSFSGFRLREVRGRRYIGDNVPGSVVIKSTGDGLWPQKLKDKCEEIFSSIEQEHLLKYLRDRCKTRNADLRDIFCHGKMGASRDCRGIFIP